MKTSNIAVIFTKYDAKSNTSCFLVMDNRAGTKLGEVQVREGMFNWSDGLDWHVKINCCHRLFLAEEFVKEKLSYKFNPEHPFVEEKLKQSLMRVAAICDEQARLCKETENA
ncbi:TPA: hypothetical protein I7682_18085 [Vibrio vulnificus]|nr:hypothetical protein [Vibrio vulnificus]